LPKVSLKTLLAPLIYRLCSGCDSEVARQHAGFVCLVSRLSDPSMGHDILITHKEREYDALLRLAREIVEAGERRGRPLSPGEDAMVSEFLKRAQVLEQEISLLRRDQWRVIPSKHRETEDA
jgi:hypothetical protein